MNVALIGAGSIAEDHARAIAALHRAQPAADLRLQTVVGRLPEPTAAFARALEAELSFYAQVFGLTPPDPVPPVAIANLPGPTP